MGKFGSFPDGKMKNLPKFPQMLKIYFCQLHRSQPFAGLVKLLRKKVDDMVSLKPNLKEHTPLSHTGEKPVSASLVSTWLVLSPTRLGLFAHWPQDACVKNVRPHKSQSFNTVNFQLFWTHCSPKPLLVSQCMVCEAGSIHCTLV